MTVKLPKWARALIYAVNVLGAPVVVYARAKDWIGDLELALWSAEVAAGFTLAGLNLPATEQPTTVKVNVTAPVGSSHAEIRRATRGDLS